MDGWNLLQDTTFGAIVRAVSGGKIFAWKEQSDPALVERYLNGGPPKKYSNTASDAPTNTVTNAASDVESFSSRPTTVIDDKDPDDKDVERGDSYSPPDPLPDAEKGSDAGKERDYHLVDWIENDPAHPRNWPTMKKFFVTFQICLLTTSVYIGAAIYTAGLVDVERQFNVSETVALLGLTLFVLGYGLGPMLWAPMSEVPFFGRNPIYLGTLFVFVALQPAVVYAKNIGMLLAFRFLTGFIGSPVLATGGASISDMYAPNKRAYGISIWGLAAVLGPVGGPLIAGYATQFKGWTWSIWELMWLSGFCLVFLFFLLPETSSANILFRRTQRLRKLVDPKLYPVLKCEPEIEGENMNGREIVMMILVRPFTLNLEPILLVLNLYIALLYALLYIWFESFPIVFVGIYHFNNGELGLAFLGILIAVCMMILPLWWYLHKYTEPQFKNGELTPELRLPPAFVGGICIPICLFWFGWSARESVHWIVPIIGTMFFGFGAYLLFNCVLNYLGDAYPKYAASAYAGNDLMRSSFGAAFPLFATAMYHKLGVGWASSLLGFLALMFVPVPFVIYRYGPALRQRSKLARHDN